MVITTKPEKEGFETVFQNSAFKCAFISPSNQYAYGKVTQLKRHNDTDEVFVLLRGKAVLLTREDANDKCDVINVEPFTAYNVKASTWHYLAVSEDAEVFVTESGALDPKNTDAADVSEEGIIAEIL